MVVRKIGFPGQDQLAIGAVASGGVIIRNQSIIDDGRVDETTFSQRAASASQEVVDIEVLLRGERPPLSVEGKSVVLVDDGLATGATMKAAIEAARGLAAKRITVGVPVAPAEALTEIEQVSDETVFLLTPSPFYAVGVWYQRFPQVSTQEVRQMLLGA